MHIAHELRIVDAVAFGSDRGHVRPTRGRNTLLGRL